MVSMEDYQFRSGQDLTDSVYLDSAYDMFQIDDLPDSQYFNAHPVDRNDKTLDYLDGNLSQKKESIPVSIVNYKKDTVSIQPKSLCHTSIIQSRQSTYALCPLWMFSHNYSDRSYLILTLPIIVRKVNKAPKRSLSQDPEDTGVSFVSRKALVYFVSKQEVLNTINGSMEPCIPDYTVYDRFRRKNRSPQRYKPLKRFRDINDHRSKDLEIVSTVNSLQFYFGDDVTIKVGIFSYVRPGMYKSQLGGEILTVDYGQVNWPHREQRVWNYESQVECKLNLLSDDPNNSKLARGCIKVKDLSPQDKLHFQWSLRNKNIYFFILKTDLFNHLKKGSELNRIISFCFTAEDMDYEMANFHLTPGQLFPKGAWTTFVHT